MRPFASALLLCLSLSVGPALAQDDTTTYLFGEYYVCDQNREVFSDYLAEHVFGPVYDKHVEAGHLDGWGWLGHRAGGHWRRVLYYSASSLETLLETRDKIIEEFQSNLATEGRELTDICPQHDDLIWALAAGPAAAQQLTERGPAAYSTYYICDASRQERADEIVRELIAPAASKLVESGELKSFGWYAHVIGGRFRRLMTHNGMSHTALIQAVNKYNQAATETNEALSDEFSQICDSHVDYLWDQILPKPAGDN